MHKNEQKLTVDRLRVLFSYDPETGKFVRNHKGKTGSPVSDLPNKGGYLRVRVDGPHYYAHRLAWLYVNGAWPKRHIDHINGDRSDNRIANLREATPAENHQNRALSRKNSSGFTGVFFDKRRKKWIASIGVNRRSKFLGSYSSPEEAAEAYAKAKAKIHRFNPKVRGGA